MISHIVTDLRRELEKARIALDATRIHLAAHAEANAALHMSPTVMYSPLHTAVCSAIEQIGHALGRSDAAEGEAHRVEALAAVLADLDRCQHGRHEGDTCADCAGPSKGNPHLRTGTVVGYDIHAKPIVMPGREQKHDPQGWCGDE